MFNYVYSYFWPTQVVSLARNLPNSTLPTKEIFKANPQFISVTEQILAEKIKTLRKVQSQNNLKVFYKHPLLIEIENHQF